MEQYQNIQEGEATGEKVDVAWGTWEELLLACAVKRHGVEDWDSVAMEVQGKTSLSQLHTTAFNCRQKYHDLQRRFHQDEEEEEEEDEEEEDSDPIPWLHHLKNLRLAQLRHDLNRYDVSIMSLETKVKRLEEERKHDEEDQTKPDLEEHNSKRHGSNSRSEETLNDKKEKNGQDRFKQENQSANGSNSTCSKTQEDHHHHLHNKNNNKISSSAEPEAARAGQSDSDNGSCETVRRRERGSGSSEAQSSASLTRQRRRMLQRSEQVEAKSQPLAAVLEMIRAHQHGYLFERRLTSQESEEYKSMVYQHVDLAAIEAKLQNRTDSSSSESTYSALQFYRDLLVLFTNAVVFFPKSSTEFMAANQLRRLVLNEMNKSNFITTRPVHPSSQALLPKIELEQSDSLLAKHKSTTPIFVCRKRSSITSKPSSIARMASTTALGASDVKPLNNSKANIAAEDNVSASAAAAKADEKPVTGTVSSRRTANTDHEINAKDSSTKKTFAETPKGGRKRKAPEEEPAIASNKRTSGAADFLKRLKRNSPTKQKVNLKSGTGSSSGAEQKKRGGNNNKKPQDKVKERVSKQSGGDNKKQVKEESSPSKRSVGRPSKKATDTLAAANVASAKRSRENVAKQQQQRPPRKRSRR